jgi:alcohol dehydrogenase
MLEGLREILRLAQVATPLAELGVTRAVLPALGAEAAQQWTAQFNPRTIGADDFARLYEEALT